MTRILHLVAGNHRRGAETFAVELAEHHRGVGHEVRVMAVTDSGVSDPLPIEVAAAHRADPRGAARIVVAARWSEVVVSFGSSSLSVGALAARLTRRPFVYRQIGDPGHPPRGARRALPARHDCGAIGCGRTARTGSRPLMGRLRRRAE